MKMAIDQQSKLKSTSQPSMKLKNIFDYVYVLLGISCFATVAIAAIFVWNVHRFNDLSVLRENLKNDLIVDDIKHIVRIVLQELGNEYQPLHEARRR